MSCFEDNLFDVVIEYDVDGDPLDYSLTAVESELGGPDSLRMSTEEAPESVEASADRQVSLSRFIFDCKKSDKDSFAVVLCDGLELFGLTEIDLVKLFAVRLERAEAWLFGSDVPLDQMRLGILKWLVGLAEAELGE